MPIRINLLAESQAAEELRRKDPVKRSIYVCGCLVVMVLVWISSLQVKIMADNSHLGSLQERLSSRTNEYSQVLRNRRKLADVNDKLESLNKLAVNRVLQGTLLDSLMHATVDGIQITKFRLEQGFDTVAEVKPTVDNGRTFGGHPASSREKDKLVLNARDSSANPGSEQINKFKEALAATPYFEAQQIPISNILLKNLSPPQLDGESGKPYVLFTLECSYPDRLR